MNKLVYQIQMQLTMLGFPDVRDQIQKGLQSGEKTFKIDMLKFFKRPGRGGDDFLQYGAEVLPGAQDQQFLTTGHVTLLRVRSDRDNNELSFAQLKEQYQAVNQKLPSILSAYLQLREKMDKRSLKKPNVVRERKPGGRQINPRVNRWRGRNMN